MNPIGLSTFKPLVARAIMLLSSFIVTPLLIENVGLGIYGQFATLLALAGVFGLADFGVSNTLVSEIAHVDNGLQACDRRSTISGIISSGATFVLRAGATFGLGLIVLVAIGGMFEFSWLESGHIEVEAIFLYLVMLGVGLPVDMYQKVLLGLRQSERAFTWLALISVLTATSLFLGSLLEQPLLALVAAQWGVPLVMGLVAWRQILVTNQLKLTWRANPDILKRLKSRGRMFLILQSVAFVAYQLDSAVVLLLLGDQQAGLFSATWKALSVPIALSSFIFLPMWAEVAQMNAQHRVVDMRNLLTKSLVQALLVGAFCFVLISCFGGQAVSIWTAGAVQPPTGLVLAAAAAVAVWLVTQPVTMVLNGVHAQKVQYVFVPLALVLNVSLSVYLTISLGVSGPLWGTVVSQILFALSPQLLWLYKRKLRIKT